MKKQLLDKKVIDILNYRIQQEEFSARLYKDMHLWFEDKGFLNLAKVYEKYSKEERTHAEWAMEFLLDYGIKPTLRTLISPESEYSNVKEILDATLEHELLITSQCKELTKFAKDNDEYVLYTLGLKYLAEQQEEISHSQDFISIYENSDNDLVFDNYIGENYLG